MVDWFNQVDAAYRSDLREVNELNFARFDAKMEQRFAESDTRMERRFAASELAFEKRFADSERAVEQRFSALERQIAKLALDLKEQQVVQMRCMIGMWVVVLVAVLSQSLRR